MTIMTIKSRSGKKGGVGRKGIRMVSQEKRIFRIQQKTAA